MSKGKTVVIFNDWTFFVYSDTVLDKYIDEKFISTKMKILNFLENTPHVDERIEFEFSTFFYVLSFAIYIIYILIQNLVKIELSVVLI